MGSSLQRKRKFKFKLKIFFLIRKLYSPKQNPSERNITRNLLSRKNFLQLLSHVRFDSFWEVDTELNDELPFLEGVSVGGHSLAVNALDVAVLDHFTWG